MGFGFVRPTLHHRHDGVARKSDYAGIYQFIIVAVILATRRSCQSREAAESADKLLAPAASSAQEPDAMESWSRASGSHRSRQITASAIGRS
jgi:hypothetical protein